MRAAPIDNLIAHLSRLPGVGERSATRLAFHLLRAKPQFRAGLAQAVSALENISLCQSCRTVTEENPCPICSSPVRKDEILCVVEKPSDIYAIERLSYFQGKYFVLHGLLSPLEGISAEDLGIEKLAERISQWQPRELILALNPTVEGDATTTYLAHRFRNASLQVSRLASGLPTGSELEYADQITLGKAFEGRTELR